MSYKVEDFLILRFKKTLMDNLYLIKIDAS
jgi:hypothetical protein